MTSALQPVSHGTLITGASKRVGRLMAEGAAREGHSVVVHYNHSHADALDVVNHIKSHGGYAVSIKADLSVPEEAKGLLPKAMEALGRPITALINNASLFEFDSPQALDPEVNARAWLVNYLAPLQLVADMARLGPSEGDMVVINMLDQKLWNMNPDFYSYTGSKAALHTATTMIDQADPSHLRACGIAPGIHFPSPLQTQAEFEAVASRNLRRRPIDPTDIVAAAMYILRSPGVRRQILHIDNGERFVPSARDVSFLTSSDI